MILLFTDFGFDDIYVAQVKAALLEHAAPDSVILDLLHSVPRYRVRAGAHLLAALQERFPPGAVFVAVVDPGVGTSRDAAILQADGKWYVGPDNGLLSVVSARAVKARAWRIDWRPQGLSNSFHGRDLFAPVAALIATNKLPPDWTQELDSLRVQLGAGDLAEVVYIDHYGNALTGLRAASVPRTAAIAVRGRRLSYARVFAEAPAGSAFWYENSIGLVELSADRDGVAALLGLQVGDALRVIE